MLTDHIGSVDVVTDSSGTPMPSTGWSYDAFGQRRNPTTWAMPQDSAQVKADRQAVTHRGFTGHEDLDGLGLVHMNGRVYDPNLGRFLSVDPVFQFPTNTQSLNPYSYVLNNPLSATDPTGYYMVACAPGKLCFDGGVNKEGDEKQQNNGNTQGNGTDINKEQTDEKHKDVNSGTATLGSADDQNKKSGLTIPTFDLTKFSALVKDWADKLLGENIVSELSGDDDNVQSTLAERAAGIPKEAAVQAVGVLNFVSQSNIPAPTITPENRPGAAIVDIAVLAIGGIEKNAVEEIGVKLAEKDAGLGNPFKGKSASEIHDMFIRKGYEPRGPNPISGKGGYVNPDTGRSYHIDPDTRTYRSGTEQPHVDVNRSPDYNGDLEKRKYPMGDVPP